LKWRFDDGEREKDYWSSVIFHFSFSMSDNVSARITRSRLRGFQMENEKWKMTDDQ